MAASSFKSFNKAWRLYLDSRYFRRRYEKDLLGSQKYKVYGKIILKQWDEI